MSSANRLLGGLLAVSISLIALAPPIPQSLQAQTQDSQRQEIQVLLDQASQLRQQGQSQQEIATYRQILTLGRQLKDQEAEAIALQSLGFIYQNIGQPRQSLEFYQQALPLFKAIANRAQQAATLSNIGLVYGYLGAIPESLRVFKLSLIDY